MAILPLRLYPDPILRQSCPAVERFDDRLRRLAQDMVATMHAAPGIGLAAPQVGAELRLAVVDLSVGQDPGELHILANPEIIAQRGRVTEVEGCLSIPGVNEKVERPAAITVRAFDLEGRPFELAADGLLARAVCHEVDHLAGVLFIDRLTGLKRERVRRQLRRMVERQEVLA